MSRKVIGILGGMGPEATLACFAMIIQNTPATRDQDHLRVIIYSNPEVPDRTAAITGKGESPVPMLVQGCRTLAQAGADFIIIPCVSAHYFLEELQEQTTLPILSIFDMVAEAIATQHPGVKKVGLLATSGTIQGRAFQKRLSESDIETITCEAADQNLVMQAIYDLKKSSPQRSRPAIRADLIEVVGRLIRRGAAGIVAGCTEIPLALSQEHLQVPYFDSLGLLARAAIRQAGIEPLSDSC
ncbi:MAG: amino acid racemase [Deltaproteobacteria bacterium]|nr:amino acid racemase [Deltaproteobacteria bacterium]MBW2071518.1 amino acid racemase [Deltaproteobacteria bacterium]